MHIKFRKKIKGPEAKLVEDFLQNIEIFYQEDLEYDFFMEPYAEVGIPDIVIIGWDKKMLTKWSPKRTDLSIKDIKIMHHISSFKNRGVAITKLKEQLGYPQSEMEKSLSLLSEANLIRKTERRVFAEDLDHNFFIRQIITIEAKIKNWKDAFHQAQLNENFSSHSYVLLPEKIVSPKVKSKFNTNIGLLAHNGERVVLKKRAKKGSLPSSYFSWIINEHVGRKLFTTV